MVLCICYLAASLALPVIETPESDQPVDSVRHLLVLESQTDEATKDRVSALQKLRTDSAPNSAWWHSGFINVDGTWKPYEHVVTELTADRTTREYARLREPVTTASDHWRLAKWCQTNRMTDRHRLHAAEAFRIDPKVARPNSPGDLGLVECLGIWVRPEVASQLQQEKEYQQRCFEQWNPQCQRIVRKLAGTVGEIREGERLLSEIKSPDAVPVIDFVIGRTGAQGARYAVNAISRTESVRSSRILANYAVWSPIKSVRDTAINALADRRHAHFVPPLLDLLATEITEQKIQTQVASNTRDLLGHA